MRSMKSTAWGIYDGDRERKREIIGVLHICLYQMTETRLDILYIYIYIYMLKIYQQKRIFLKKTVIIVC